MRCDAYTRDRRGRLTYCGEPATHILTITPQPGVHLHPDTVAEYCGERPRCADHADVTYQGHYLRFAARPIEVTTDV